MSIEAAREHLRGFGVEDRLQEFSVSSATVALAAEAVGCEAARIAKTLSFLAPENMDDPSAVLVVAAGDARVDNAKFKAHFGYKARMVPPERAEGLVGHAVGGVCPFGIPPAVEVWLDASLKRFSTVFPACGSANSCIELTLPELEEFSGASGWVEVCVSRETPPDVV